MSFLGVARSLTDRCWVGPTPAIDRLAEAMAQETALPRPLCQTLCRLDVAPSDATTYLEPKLRDLMPDPRSLKDMETAAARFLAAVERNEKIAVFADYDVDGGCSAALLIDWLRQMGRSATLYVPDRIDEGYGPNAPAMTELAAAHDLILCVDCGTLSHDALAAVTSADVLVLDHHLGGESLPPALAVVNPNRQDESGDLAHLCAAAVVFLMLVEAGRQLREAGKPGPDLMAMLDLVALATVADVARCATSIARSCERASRSWANAFAPGLWRCAISDASIPPRPRITWALFLAPVSMPAAGWAALISALACLPAPIRPRPSPGRKARRTEHRTPRCRNRRSGRGAGPS